MRLLTILGCLTATAATLAQTAAIPAAKPEDVKSIDSIVAALYDVISGPPGAKHDWDRFRSLFLKDARLSAVTSRRGMLRCPSFTPDDYVKLDGPIIEKGGFSEREIARHTDQFANMVNVFSTYESRIKADDKKPFARGINSIQLFNDGQRWWVVSIYWQDESKDNPLPEKYLRSTLNGK